MMPATVRRLRPSPRPHCQATGEGGAAVGNVKARFLALAAAFLLCGLPTRIVATELPPDNAYVVVKDGHLSLDGKRVRFWGGIGGMPAFHVYRWALKAGKEGVQSDGSGHETEIIQKAVDRIEAYGFNMFRMWTLNQYFDEQPNGYVKGDRSLLDLTDEGVAELKRRGIRIWVGGAGDGGTARAEDVDIIDDPGTAEAWKAAVGKGTKCSDNEAAAWDPRLEAISIRNTRARLSRVNHHTGMRVADDPVFSVWELTNEQWWIQRMVGGRWQKLEPFFRDTLLKRWQAFLTGKYKDDQGLTTAWLGLLPGESLRDGTILLAPMRDAAAPSMFADANPQSAAKFENIKTPYGRSNFNAARARDVNEFFAGLILGHKQRLAAAFKTIGKSTLLSPLLHDTGMGYDGINQLVHQQADAVSYCAYVGGITHDPANPRFPWSSGLEMPPTTCLNVPWLEHNRVEGKPFLCYETNIGSPTKFRAEYPYRLLALATIQDWDAVCWHTLSGGYWWTKPNPLIDGLSAPGNGAAQFNMQYDEVLLSAIHAAGTIFVGQSLKPAPKPTTFIFGRKTIFSDESMDYAGSYGKNGLAMHDTTYRYGMRLKLDLGRDDDEIIGPVVDDNRFRWPQMQVKPTDQLTFDWRKGSLVMASTAAAVYTGFLGLSGGDSIRFGNGVDVTKVQVVNPPDAPYPVTPEENYVSIAISSSDGLPLAECRTAVISAVSTSMNTGVKVSRDPKGPDRPGHVWAGLLVENTGTQSVSRVACTITAPALAGMRYRMRDWLWNVVASGAIPADGVLAVSGTLPVFLIELER